MKMSFSKEQYEMAKKEGHALICIGINKKHMASDNRHAAILVDGPVPDSIAKKIDLLIIEIAKCNE